MNTINKKVNQNQMALLQKIKGKKLIKLDYADVLTDDTSWNTLRLHFDDESIDINCFLENTSQNNNDSYEECGIFSVSPAPFSQTLEVPDISSDISTILINKTVDGITIVDESVKTIESGISTTDRQTTKAIVLSLEDTLLGIDRRIFYEEVLTFKFGRTIEEVIHDDSDSWLPENESDITFEYSIEKVSL